MLLFVQNAWTRTETIPAPTRHRLIVADTSHGFRSTVASLLRDNGYAVVEAPDGIELASRLAAALTGRWKRDSCDLVICDARLAGKEGIEVFAELADVRGLPPVVFTVQPADGIAAAHAYRLGALAVLEKPIEVEGLLALVHQAVRRGSA